jgi:hypothetical protein
MKTKISLLAILLSSSYLNAVDIFKFEAFINTNKIETIYADNDYFVSEVKNELKNNVSKYKEIIIQFDDSTERNQLEIIKKEFKKENKKIEYLASELKLKEEILSKIKNKLKEENLLKQQYTLEDIKSIRRDVYFYEREIYRYKIDYEFFYKHYNIINSKREDIQSRLDNKKIIIPANIYVKDIYVKKGQAVKPFDRLVTVTSLYRPYFKIKLNEEAIKDMKNYVVDVIVFHNETKLDPIGIKTIKDNKDMYLIITLDQVSKYFLKDKFEIIIKKQKKIQRTFFN